MHDRIVFAALTRLAAVNGGLHRLVRREPFEVGQRQLGLKLRGICLGALHLVQPKAQRGQGSASTRNLRTCSMKAPMLPMLPNMPPPGCKAIG